MPKKEKEPASAKKREIKERLSCNRRPSAGQKKVALNTDRIYRHKGGYRWSGIRKERYKQEGGGWSAISRNVLVGSRGETPKFHLRYFEIAPGGFSSMERHRHEHVVVCIRGKGRVRIGDKSYTVKHLDTVYIAPGTVHQLSNPTDEPFGFFCIVNAKRDKPRLIALKYGSTAMVRREAPKRAPARKS